MKKARRGVIGKCKNKRFALIDERDLSWSHVLCCDLYWTLVTFWISTDPLICQNGSLGGSGGMVDLERPHVCFWILGGPCFGAGSCEDLVLVPDPVKTLWQPRIL